MSRMKAPLSQVINNFLIIRDEDSYVKNASRTKIISLARRGMQELLRNVGGSLKSVRIDVEEGFFIELPNDFMAFSKIGVVRGDNSIQILKINDKMDISREFLKDQNGDVLVDSDGIEQLAGRGTDNQFTPNDALNTFGKIPFHNYYFQGSYFQLYGVPAGNNVYGDCRVDYTNNRIEFSSNLFTSGEPQQVVLEYVADETMRKDPVIDIRLHEALYAFIYWKLVETMYKAPMNEKQNARNEYYNRRRLAMKEMRPVKLQEIIHVLREGNKKAPKF